MFCTKCGTEFEGKFCPNCGNNGNVIDKKEENVGMLATTTVCFKPRKPIVYWGNFFMKKATINMNGVEKICKFKSDNIITVKSGEYNIECSFKSLFFSHTGKASQVMQLEAGKKYEVVYKPNWIWGFLEGKLSIKEVL